MSANAQKAPSTSRRGPTKAPQAEAPRPLAEVASRSGPGEALPLALRDPAERSLGTPLADVRLHRGDDAARFTGMAGAKAAQWRNHIFVRPDLYAPDTTAGRDLLGHELVHSAQFSAFGEGSAPVSAGGAPSESEARSLGPQVLSGTPGAAAPTTAPAAAVNRDGDLPGPLTSSSSLACDANDWMVPDNQGQTLNTPAGPQPADTPAPALADTTDPALIDVHALTNADLIATDIHAQEMEEECTVSTATTAGWADLKVRLAAERQRRIGLGFMFLADQRRQTPAMLVQLTGGHGAGTTSVVVADPAMAMGAIDVTLAGPIMSGEQFQAYLRTAGIQIVSGERAARMMEAIRGGQLSAGFQTPVPDGRQRDPFGLFNPAATGFSYFRNSPRDNLATYGPDRWLMPIDSSGNRGPGNMGELSLWMGPDAQRGTNWQDLNAMRWQDVEGVWHEVNKEGTTNFPVADAVLTDPTGQRGPRNASVAVGDTNYLLRKFDILLDATSRRTQPAAPGPATDAASLAHLRTITGNAQLAPGTAPYDVAQHRFLGDTYFAVPDAQLAQMRSVISNPNTAPKGANSPITTGYRSLYDHVLAQHPITKTLGNGQQVTINSVDALIQVLPNSERAPSARVAGGPGTASLNPAQRAAVFTELGQLASSCIIPESNSATFMASADLARGFGAKPDVAATRVLSIDSADPGYTGRAIRDALGTPAEASWRNARSTSGGDRYLSFARQRSGRPDLTRADPQFAQIRSELIRDSVLSFPEEQRTALLEAIATDKSQRAQDIRAALATEFPGANPRQQADAMMATFDLPQAEIDAARQYSMDMANGGQKRANLNADALAARRPSTLRSTATHYGGSAGRGAAGSLLSAVVTDSLDYATDRPMTPYSGQRLLMDTGFSMAQEEAERQISQRLIARLAISNSTLRGVAGRAGPGFILQPIVSMGFEAYSLGTEDYDHSGGEIAGRLGHAGGSGLAAAGAGGLMAMAVGSTVFEAAVAGAVGGSLAGPVGTVVGFILVGAAAATAAYFADKWLPGSAESYHEDQRQRELAQLRRMEEERRRRPLMTFGGDNLPMPMTTSKDITPEEQALIAQWFMAGAGRGPAPSAAYAP